MKTAPTAWKYVMLKTTQYSVTCVVYGRMLNAKESQVSVMIIFNSLLSKVLNISCYCEVNLCNSRIKQLIHNHYNDLEKFSDLPSLRSLQAEQGNHCLNF